MLSPDWENLDEFLGLDTQDGFAKKAILALASTEATRNLVGIFDEPYLDAQLGEYRADESAPRFLCKHIDVIDVARGDRLSIEGVVYDVMSAAQPDGTGMATLYLEVPPDDQYRS